MPGLVLGTGDMVVNEQTKIPVSLRNLPSRGEGRQEAR